MDQNQLVQRAKDEVLAELLKRKQQRKKDLNSIVLSVRASNELAVKVRNHCSSNNISTNQFFKNLLNEFFNHA